MCEHPATNVHGGTLRALEDSTSRFVHEKRPYCVTICTNLEGQKALERPVGSTSQAALTSALPPVTAAAVLPPLGMHR